MFVAELGTGSSATAQHRTAARSPHVTWLCCRCSTTQPSPPSRSAGETTVLFMTCMGGVLLDGCLCARRDSLSHSQMPSSPKFAECENWKKRYRPRTCFQVNSRFQVGSRSVGFKEKPVLILVFFLCPRDSLNLCQSNLLGVQKMMLRGRQKKYPMPLRQRGKADLAVLHCQNTFSAHSQFFGVFIDCELSFQKKNPDLYQVVPLVKAKKKSQDFVICAFYCSNYICINSARKIGICVENNIKIAGTSLIFLYAYLRFFPSPHSRNQAGLLS